MRFEIINLLDIEGMAGMYVETFNAPPWNDEWTIETASKRLHQMINCEGFYGLIAYQDEELSGMILGSEEQYYNGVMFNIKEFCVKNEMRNRGIGTKMLEEFEKQLKEKEISEIILFTSRDDSTEDFYQKRGLESYNGMVMMGKQL